MPLNLSEFLPMDETITTGKESFVLSSQIPARIVFEFNEISNLEAEGFGKKEYDILTAVIKEMLYVKNDKEKVDKFLDTISAPELLEVIKFIADFINQSITNVKKKTG